DASACQRIRGSSTDKGRSHHTAHERPMESRGNRRPAVHECSTNALRRRRHDLSPFPPRSELASVTLLGTEVLFELWWRAILHPDELRYVDGSQELFTPASLLFNVVRQGDFFFHRSRLFRRAVIPD